jgi:hypothetical protein
MKISKPMQINPKQNIQIKAEKTKHSIQQKLSKKITQ